MNYKNKKITMADPHFDSCDRERIHREVDNILDSALSMGPNVVAFQEEFAKKMNVRHAVAMNSCTSVLEAALLAHKIRDKEVIVPSQTFIATGMAIHLSGGSPVFAEISPETMCLDIDDVKSKDYGLLQSLKLDHPILSVFRDSRYSDFTNLHFWNYR